ncbi:hypothetical protein SMC26_23870 [Actinomadura fulvescens]|uniref:Uncharacterized protein n=1 Tax=Actinomadura fulvescens TaxID=46160 RepID=A0ABP6CH99_9ACTN
MTSRPQGFPSNQEHSSPTSTTCSRLGSDISRASADAPRIVPSAPTGTRLLYDVTRPVHSGILGAYANDWLRVAFVEALVSDERLPDIVTTRRDLDVMFCGRASDAFLDDFNERLRVFECLEDAIEHLETRAVAVRSGQPGPTTVWFATPGNDADVVNQTIEFWAGLDMIALLRGPWPYGPNRHPQPVHRSMHRTQVFIAQPVNDSIALLQEGA